MKNSMFDYKEIYHFIRNAYMTDFPHPHKFKATKTIQAIMAWYSIDGEVVSEPGAYVFHFTSPRTVKNNSPFLDSTDKKIAVENFIAEPANILVLVYDLQQMNDWLVRYGYVTEDGIVSEKMILSSKLQD